MNLNNKDKMYKSLVMASVMLLSTLLSTSSISAINETVEFSTDGDILLLDGASNAIISLSMDNPQTENFDESDEIRDITFLRHRLPNKEATSITHDNTDLYIGWNDGLVEHYAKQDGTPPFVHWVKTGDNTFAPPAISVQLTDQGKLSWVTLDDNKIRIIGKSDFDLSFPQIIEKTIVGAENGISSFTLLDGQLMALDSSGNSIMETTSTQDSDSLAVISKMWAREDLRSVKAVSSIRNGLGTDGSGSSQLLVVESGGLRLLEMAPSVERTHILQTTPSADIILPWAGSAVSDETIQSRTVLKFANNDEQSKRRSFPLQVTFGNTPPFTHTVNGTTVQGGKITLSIAGVEKTLSWQDVSNNTMIWEPDNSAQTSRFSRTHVPDTIEVEIVDWTPKNVNFSGEIRIVGDTTDNSTGGGLALNGIRFSNDLGGIATSPFNNGTASIYGNKVLDDIDNSYKVSWIDNFKPSRENKKGTWDTKGESVTHGVGEGNWFERDWNLNDVSVNNPPGGFTHAEFILHGARVDLVDATPMQSVIEPTRYTQDKNMWWNVEVNHEKSSVGIIGAGHPETIPVALEVRGVNCQRFGVKDSGYGINDMTPIVVRNLENTSGRELAPNVERWHECPYEYRTEMTWAKSEIYNSGARVYTGGVSKAAMLGVKVYTLEFDVPLDSLGTGSAVLPFDKNEELKHLDMWVRPAEPNDDNYLTDDDGTGMVKWKVIVDPDNTVNESTSERADNRESAEEETIYFDDDSYDVMVVRTKLVYKECANWNFWNNCVSFYSEGDKPGNFLEAPSAEWANLQIDYSSPKMQEMFPIPEGRLNMYLYDNVLEITTTQQPTRFHLNGWGNKLQRTASFLNVITEGIRLGEAQDNPPDRVLMLYDHNAAAVDNDPSNQMFGWMAFGGIAPCSSAALSSDFYENSGNYDLMGGNPIHELSHTMLAGHDNFGLMDSTLNNCGLESAYRPGEGASGFMPSGIPIMDQTDSPHYVSIPMTESWVEGASHMRYSHDGTKLDTDGDGTLDTLEDENGGRVPLSDFYYKNQWIQNVDYELIQDQYSYNSEESFLLKWGELALTDEIQGLALTGILVFDLIMTGLIALIIAGFSSANPVGWVLSALLAIVLIIVIGMVNSLIDSALSTSSTAEEIETARSVTSISQYLDFELTTNDWNDHLSMPIITALNNNIRMNNLSTTESNLSIVIRDYQGGIVSETPLETYTALSGLGDGSETHHGIIPWDSDAASYEVVKDGVVIDSGSLVAPDASTLTIAGDLRSEFQHGERIQLQIEDSTNGIDYDLNDPYCTGDGNGFNSFTDQANDESGLTATQNTFETYDIYTSLNGGENWQLRSKGQHSPCIDIETTKSMVTENFMVKVVADDGLHTREAISNEIAITGSVHWLSWMSSEEALPGDQIMMEIESRQMPADGCNYSISTPGWTLENPIENSDTNYSATLTFTVQAPEDAYSGINKLSIDATCGNNTQEIPVKVRVRGGKDMPKSTAPMVVELAPPPGYNSEEDFSEWEIPDFRNGTFMIDTDEDGIPDRFDECVTTPNGFEINETGCAVPSTVSGEDGGDGTDSATDNSGDVSTQGELVEGYDLIYLLGALILGVILGVAVVSMKGDEEDE